MIFYKTSTSGNDFIIVDRGEFDLTGRDPGEFAREICNRDHGAGADGIIFYSHGENITGFRIINSDGSGAEISGNGMAGLASVLFFLDKSREKVTLESPAGTRSVELAGREGNTFLQIIDMGSPRFDNKGHFPFLVEERLNYEYGGMKFFPVSTGNPHAVILLEGKEPQIGDLISTGKILGSAEIFPQGTNVEFVHPFNTPQGDNIPLIRTVFVERGAGVTPFSSTGSTAVFSVLARLGLVGDRIRIAAGDNDIPIHKTGDNVFIESSTKIVYKGEYDIK
jgi:diaminopimelate epimerase